MDSPPVSTQIKMLALWKENFDYFQLQNEGQVYKIIYATALCSLIIMLIIYSRENYFDGQNNIQDMIELAC